MTTNTIDSNGVGPRRRGWGGWSAGWSGSAALGPPARPRRRAGGATELAWRAGVAEGLRLAQLAIRKGV